MIWFKHSHFRLFPSLFQGKDASKVPIDLSQVPLKMSEVMKSSGSRDLEVEWHFKDLFIYLIFFWTWQPKEPVISLSDKLVANILFIFYRSNWFLWFCFKIACGAAGFCVGFSYVVSFSWFFLTTPSPLSTLPFSIGPFSFLPFPLSSWFCYPPHSPSSLKTFFFPPSVFSFQFHGLCLLLLPPG